MPVHDAQSASQPAQVALLVRAAGGGLVLTARRRRRSWLQVASLEPPQAAVWY